MFYNGLKDQPAEQILKLSDSYLEKTEAPMLELEVKMININPSAGHPILTESRSLYEYSYFNQKIRDNLDSGMEREAAIRQAMQDCLQEGIMVDFIQEHGSEVINMLFTEFNMEDALEVRGEERYAEGKAEGRIEGRTEGEASSLVRIIRAKLEKGIPETEIAGILETDEEFITGIASLIRAYPEADDRTIAGYYLERMPNETQERETQEKEIQEKEM